MKRYLCGLVAVGMVFGVSGAAKAQPRYVFTTLDLPGTPFGINNAGQIVGSTNLNRGFLYSGGSSTKIEVPGWPVTSAFGINNAGQIVGEAGFGAVNPAVGFLLSGGIYTTYSVPNAFRARGIGISDSGQIVGTYSFPPPRFAPSHGFQLTGGNFILFDVPGAVYTEPHGINDSGQIVGNSSLSGFLLSGGNIISIAGSALSINNSGQIVGTYSDSAGFGHGFLYVDGNYTTVDVPFAIGTGADGINDLGQIVGQYTSADRTVHAFLATPTPEPSALLLLVIATVGLMGWAWRRLKRG